MRRRLFALVLLGAAIAGACSSFSSDDTVATTADGGATPEADAPDVSSDAAPVLADGGLPFCSTVDAQFCWSFDEDTLPLTGTRLTPSGNPPSLTDAASSPPGAMSAALGDGGYVQGLYLAVPPPVTLLHCESDVFFETIDTTADDILLVDQDWNGSFFAKIPALGAKQNAGIVRITLKFGTSPQTADLGNLPVGQWQHLVLESALVNGQWVVSGQAGTTAGAFDGGPVDASALPEFNKVFWGLGTLGNVHWRARYDNLFCRWQ